MAQKKSSRQVPSVKAIGVFIDVIWIAGIALFIVSTGFVLFTLVKAPSPLMKEKGIFYAGGTYLAGTLASVVFLWIIYHLRKLIKSVKQGSPFEQQNPNWIRRIAYGFFFYIPVQTVYEAMRKGIPEIFKTDYWVGILLRDFVMPLFIGMVILVIARVFDVGVRMQQDQNLTI